MKLVNLFFLVLGLGVFAISGYLAIRPASGTHRTETGIIEGSYSGTYTNQFSQSASFAYTLADHNFMSGAADLSSPATAFGSYAGSGTDLNMNTWNSINRSYYAFQGKLPPNRDTIVGTYQNLTTTSEHGTFKLVKRAAIFN